MDASQKLAVNTLFRVEKFGNEILLYAVSKSKGIYLNETAYLIWQLCDQGHSINTIISKLEQAFPQEKENIPPEVMATIETLVNAGALVVADV